MPKMKRHTGLAKRMKVSGNGKVRRYKCGRRHLLSHKTAKRRRRLRGVEVVLGTVGRKIKNAIQ